MADPEKKAKRKEAYYKGVQKQAEVFGKIIGAKKKQKKKTLQYKASKADSVKNPSNQPYVTEVGFNKGKKNSEVTQEEFNKRYGIKW